VSAFVKDRWNGNQIRVNGEQARTDSSCTVLWVPHSRRKASTWRRNCSEMPRP